VESRENSSKRSPCTAIRSPSKISEEQDEGRDFDQRAHDKSNKNGLQSFHGVTLRVANDISQADSKCQESADNRENRCSAERHENYVGTLLPRLPVIFIHGALTPTIGGAS
jgi:hypothetical protein